MGDYYHWQRMIALDNDGWSPFIIYISYHIWFSSRPSGNKLVTSNTWWPVVTGHQVDECY